MANTKEEEEEECNNNNYNNITTIIIIIPPYLTAHAGNYPQFSDSLCFYTK